MDNQTDDIPTLFSTMKLWQKLSLFIGALVICCGLCGVIAWDESQPDYLEVDIDPPNGNEWLPVKKSVEVRSQVFYVWRREAYIPNENIESREEIFSYFHEQLRQQRWVLGDAERNLCSIDLFETSYLKNSTDYFVYHIDTYSSKTVCLAVWQEGQDWRIVFLTIND